MGRLIGKHVLGWTEEGGNWVSAEGKAGSIGSFSTDIASAWDLVDVLCARGYQLQLSGMKIWRARSYQLTAHTLGTHGQLATGSTPAEAICLAALELHAVELPK